MTRKLLNALLALILAASTLSGCVSNNTPAQASSITTSSIPQSSTVHTDSDLLTTIRDKGEIIVAMEGTWAPWTYHDESDKLVGYDVEVAQKIAQKLGVTATFVEGEWDGLLAGLDAGRYDIMVNGVNITEERSQKYDFSSPYAYDRIAVIVSGDQSAIQSFEDLSGKQTANTISSTYATLAESYGATVTGVDDLNQTFELLLSGRIDATLNAEVTYYDYMKAHPDANLQIAVLGEDATPIAIPMRKGEETAALREAVDTAINELSSSGELTALSQKYFGSDISSPNATPILEPISSAPASSEPISSAPVSSEPISSTLTTAQEASESMQIRISDNNQTIVYVLNNSSAARSLYSQLPISIGVENYASNEKIFYPPTKLDTTATPLLSSGVAGTLGYYAPFEDVILYFDSCGPASGLYALGEAVSGIDQISSLSGTIKVEAHIS